MRMDSEGIIHFSFFFYALMKGRIATISFGCLWINKFKKGGTHMKETKIYADELAVYVLWKKGGTIECMICQALATISQMSCIYCSLEYGIKILRQWM